MCFNTREG
jgi:hypothetical protein